MTGAVPEDRVRLRAIVRGRVQVLNFRAFAADHARRLRLSGTVRNLKDGRSVEVAAEGLRPALETLLARLHEGPRFARVDGVEVEWSAARGSKGEFRILP